MLNGSETKSVALEGMVKLGQTRGLKYDNIAPMTDRVKGQNYF